MPNWTQNEVTIKTKTKAKLDKIIEAINSAENVFDFDLIKPMPKNLYMGSLGREEEKKYGKNNWYHWSIENWGTKWNSCDAAKTRLSDTEVFYQFDTAWSPPLRIWEALLNIYSGQVKGCPKIKIEWHCLDEDDSTCGDGYFL